jgi:hypothetical protein
MISLLNPSGIPEGNEEEFESEHGTLRDGDTPYFFFRVSLKIELFSHNCPSGRKKIPPPVQGISQRYPC